MINLKESVLRTSRGEPILGVVIGHYNEDEDNSNEAIPTDKIGVLLTWDEAAPLLDYDYYDSWGCEDCHPVIAWTEHHLIATACYDGQTWRVSLPRNPTDHIPAFIGGG